MEIIYLTNCKSHYELVKNEPRSANIKLRCHFCDCIFEIEKRKLLKDFFPGKRRKKKFCSKTCQYNSAKTKTYVECKNCKKEFKKTPSQIKKHPNNFCSHSCSATFNNKNKKFGLRRSKMEILLEEVIIANFADVIYLVNDKSVIGSELDFYFPDLRFAIELNGIFHYEPIYGEKKFEQIKNNDQQKMIRCYEQGIELCVIDISSITYLSKKVIERYKTLFIEILKKVSLRKLEPQTGIEPATY